MTSGVRAGIVFVVVTLFAGGAVFALYHREKDEEDAARAEASSVADASADARAATAKGKPTNKKKAARGGKTRVTSRGGTGGAGGAHPSGGGAAHTGGHAGGHAGSGGGGGGGGEHHSANEGTDDGNDHGVAAPPPRPHRHYGPPSGPSFESMVDSNNQHVNIGANAGHDLTDEQLSAPVSDGTFIGECGAPDSMGVTVKVAIKMGRAVGVSVSTSPHSTEVANCVDHHIRGLSWPSSPKMDSFVTTY